MIMFARLIYYPSTNFTSVFNQKFFKPHKAQRVLFHITLFSHGPEPKIKICSILPSQNEKKIKRKTLYFEHITHINEVEKVQFLENIEKEDVSAKIIIPTNLRKGKFASLVPFVLSKKEDEETINVTEEKKLSEEKKENQTSTSNNGTSGPPVIIVKMPSLSPTMTEGTIINWLVKEGSVIAPGDVLCDIQTDKAVMSLESEEDGILAKILVPANTENVQVGTVIALIVSEGEDWRNVKLPSTEKLGKEESFKEPKAVNVSNGLPDIKSKRYGPAVKALLSTYQIQSSFIKPSGKGNRILKEDVLKYVTDNKLQKKPQMALPAFPPKSKIGEKFEGEMETQSQDKLPFSSEPKFSDKQISNMRKVIAKRLLQAKKEIPSSYMLTKCNVGALMKAKENLAVEGIRVSVNDLITKSTALALSIYPKANALCLNNQVTMSKDIDICVAVATKNGLYTPIVKSTNHKSVLAISQEIRELSEKAKSGKLKPDEYTGGTFTISNLGMFNITHFKAIINPPQCGILAVGTVSTTFNIDLKIQNHIILTLSFDRRAMNDLEAAEFMDTLKYLIENPKLILIGNRNLIALNL